MSRRRTIAVGAGLAAVGAALGRRRTSRIPTDPIDPNAIRAESAAATTADVIGRPRLQRADLAHTYASAIATAVDPLLHGRRYFPRMLDDIAVVRSEALGARSFRLHGQDLLHFDHRKMMVVDGMVGYVGGSGIEDHFNPRRGCASRPPRGAGASLGRGGHPPASRVRSR